MVCEKAPNINEKGLLIEYLKPNSINCTILLRYWSLYDKYRDMLFDYSGLYIPCKKSNEIVFHNTVDIDKQKLIAEFIDFLPSIYFDGIELQKEVSNRGIDLNSYNGTNGDFEGVKRYIRFYFCYHYDDVDDYMSIDFIKSICYNADIYNLFKKYVITGSYSGSFNSENDFDKYFYKRLESNLSFSKKEDIIILVRLKYGLRYDNKLYESFLCKLKKENEDFYELIYNFVGEKILKDSINVFNILETYYDL